MITMFFSYPFLRYALFAVLLMAPMFGLLGTLTVSHRMAFFSDALGHSALTGIALGLVLGIGNPIISLVLFGIIWAFFLTYVKGRQRGGEDTVIGVFSSTAVALGLLLLSRGGGFAKYSTFLVGDILSIQTGDLIVLAITLALTCALWATAYNKLLLTSLSVPLATSRRVPVKLVEYTLILVLTLAVMLSIRFVGTLLINSFLVLPAAASRNFSKNVRQYTILAVCIAMVSGVGGLFLSYALNASAGACMVMISACIYFISLLGSRNK